MDMNRFSYLFNEVNNLNNIKTLSVECFKFDIKLNNKFINIFSMNIRIFKAHINELIIFLGIIENIFDIMISVMISVTWLKEDLKYKYPRLSNLSLYRYNKPM